MDRSKPRSTKPGSFIGNLCLLVLLLQSWNVALPIVARGDELKDALSDLDTTVLGLQSQEFLQTMVSRDIERRRLLAIERENHAWAKVTSREAWEAFRDQRIEALRKSLGDFPPAPKTLNVVVTREITGDGYRIQNLALESRPGLWVSANLYLPPDSEKRFPADKKPAILIAHSHHNPKTQGELQDMGMNWARAGCLVLIPDLIGHGERRQHPFVTSDSYPESFPVSRQDYYFRYNVGVQLHLVGESLMGWNVWDLMRCVDLLTRRADVDPKRIIMIGGVAGGGDPAGVTAALDPRIAAVAPFNFGGPQPDYAIPQNAEEEFYYFGVAYWEMTRCLRLGARDGFAHWVIVGSVAPRKLIYASEFGWRDDDPIWPRLERVFGFYDASDHLDKAFGRGHLRGDPPENTHCNNVGPFHRQQLYPHLERWFEMPPPEEKQTRLESKELLCFTSDAAKDLDLRPVRELALELADARLAAARKQREELSPAERLKKLRHDWQRLLGDVNTRNIQLLHSTSGLLTESIRRETFTLKLDHEILVPILILNPARGNLRKQPVVVMVSQAGKKQLLKQRAKEIQALLEAGVAVCLPDLRGSGETSYGDSTGFRGMGTSLSCRDQVLGHTLLAGQLRDLRSVILFLQTRQEFRREVSLWGDSLADANPPERSVAVPHGIENPNLQGEPTAGLLVLLAALLEEDVQRVYARGTLASFRSALEDPFIYLPHEALVPEVLATGDMSDLVGALAPRPIYLTRLIGGTNRLLSEEAASSALRPAIVAYEQAQAAELLRVQSDDSSESLLKWFMARPGKSHR